MVNRQYFNRKTVKLKNEKMSKFGNYIQEAYDELLHKVTWPTWEELQQTTIIVLVALALVTGVVFTMDFASQNVMKVIYQILGK